MDTEMTQCFQFLEFPQTLIDQKYGKQKYGKQKYHRANTRFFSFYCHYKTFWKIIIVNEKKT